MRRAGEIALLEARERRFCGQGQGAQFGGLGVEGEHRLQRCQAAFEALAGVECGADLGDEGERAALLDLVQELAACFVKGEHARVERACLIGGTGSMLRRTEQQMRDGAADTARGIAARDHLGKESCK